MRIAYLIEPRKIELREEPVPTPKEGEVVVEVKAALTCGTDLKTWRRGHPKISLPTPFGHEFSGNIFSVGKGVNHFNEGDPVVLVPTAPCGECYYCQNGRENLCIYLFKNAAFGAYAEYVRVPEKVVENNLFIKPEKLSYEEGALLEPLSNVIHGLSLIEGKLKGKVLIIGAGAIGLLFLQLLRARTHGEVFVLGKRRERLEKASRTGAKAVIDRDDPNYKELLLDAMGGGKPSVVIECTGRKEGWLEAFELVEKGGIIVFFGGINDRKIELDPIKIHYGELSLLGSFHYTKEDVRRALSLLSDEKISLSSIITGRLSLEEVEKAFLLLEEGKGIKYAIIP